MKTVIGILLVLLASCSGEPNRLRPYGWKSVDAHSDSLTMALEKEWFSGGEFGNDQRLDSLINALNIYAAISENTALTCRAKYWQGRVLRRQGEEDLGQCMLDSAAFLAADPYEKVRIAWSAEPYYEVASVEYYQRLTNEATILEKTGDLPYTAGRYMELGMMLVDAGAPDDGGPYLLKADSLFKLASLEPTRLANKVNIAKCLFFKGDTAGFKQLSHELIKNPVLRQNPVGLNIAYCNLYTLGGDPAALYEAYDGVKGDEYWAGEQGFYAALLSEANLAAGNIDSARRYGAEARKMMPYIEDLSYLRDYYRAMGSLEAAEGNFAQAFENMQKFVCLNDSLNHSERHAAIVASEFHKQAQERRAAQIAAARKANFYWLLSVFFIILCFISVFWRLSIKDKAKKLRAVELELDLERANRQLLAMSLAADENEKLRQKLENDLYHMQGSALSAEASKKLLDSVREARHAAAQQQNFFKSFAEIRPNFTENLRKAYPTLSDAEVKLAVLTALNLESKEIARILGIRPESVKQARWRLRQKLGLTGGESLERVLEKF